MTPVARLLALLTCLIVLTSCGAHQNRLDLVTPGAGEAAPKRLPADMSATLCAESGPALSEMSRKHPDMPINQARKALAEACARGLQYAPTPDP